MNPSVSQTVSHPPNNRVSLLKFYSQLLSLGVILIGCIVLLGWYFDIATFKSIFPGWVTMKVNSAICFILCGTSLGLLGNRKNRKHYQFTPLSFGLAHLVILIGVMTLIEYNFGWNLGIDELFFKEPLNTIGSAAPGRMLINTAANFVMMGSSLLLLHKKVYRGAHFFAITAFLIALLGLLGYLFGIVSWEAKNLETRMAIHTAISFILLSVGILCAFPEQGIMTVFTSDNLGGILLRRLSPALILVPPILSFLIFLGHNWHLYNAEVGLSILGVFNIIVLGVPIWWGAASLDTIEKKQKQAMQALHLSEERLQLALEASDSGWWDWNIVTREIYFSPQWLQMLGYTLGEVSGNLNAWSQLIHPEDLPRVMALLTSHLEGQTPAYAAEFRMQTKSGDWKWILNSGKVVERDAKGQPVRMTGTHKDIEDRKRAEAELREAEGMYQQILDAITDMVLVKGAQSRIVWANKAFRDYYGMTPEQLRGLIDAAFNEPDYTQQYIKDDAYVFQTGQTLIIKEEPVTRHDGVVRLFDTIKSAIFNLENQVVMTVGVSRDSTERKQVADAIIASNNLLRSVIESTTDAVFAKDLQGCYVLVNSRTVSIFGKPETEILGKGDEAFFPEALFTRVKATDLRIMQTAIAETFEEIVPESNGSLQTFLTTKSPWRDKDGNVIGIVGFSRDITERKQTEIALKEANDLLQSFIESTTDAMFVKDLKGCYQLVNSRTSGIFGKPKAEILGKDDTALLPQGVANQVQGNDRRIMATGISETMEEEVPENGILRTFLSTKNPWRDREGNIKGVVGVARDISDRKSADEQLRQQEEFLRSIYDGVDFIIFVVNVTPAGERRYAGWNPACEAITGIASAAAAGKTPEELFPPERAATLQQGFSNCLAANGSFAYENNAVIDGVEIWFMVTLVPLRNVEGRIDRIIGTAINITEQKQSGQALFKQKQTLRAIIDNAPIWVWMTDVSGRMLLVNKTFCDQVGVPESQFLAAVHYSEVLGIEASTNCMASDMECLRKEVPHYSEEVIYLADDQVHYIETIKTKVKDGTGTVIGLIGIGVDVTEQRQAQRQLQESEVRFRQLAQQEALINQLASQIRSSLDLDTILETGVQQIRDLLQLDWCLFIWYLPEAEPPIWQIVHEAKNADLPSLLGEYPADVTGVMAATLSHLKLYPVDDVAALSDPIARQFFMDLGYKSMLDVPIQTASGTLGILVCAVGDQVRPWNHDEIELLQAVGDQLAIAISQAELYEQSRGAAQTAQAQAQQLEQTLRQLQQTQAQLIQAEKMSSLGQMVAGIAHEINNPVTFIFGNLIHTQEYIQDIIELVKLYQLESLHASPAIQEKLEAIDFEFLQEDLPKILNSMKVGATRIRDIVRSLRTFSRLDEAERKAVDIHENIESTLLILEHRLNPQSERPPITVFKDYGQLPRILCYPSQLNQVFMNILANGIDALEMSDPSKFSKNSQHKPWIKIQTEVSATTIMIRIADNGLGMTEETKQRLFDPFFTTKAVGKGTGMGLAISHSIIVEKHQGKIECISQVGQGSEFIIEIPLR